MNIVYNSNKAMVAYLLKHDCKVHDLKLGYNDTLLFGFDKDETEELAKEWFDREPSQPVRKVAF